MYRQSASLVPALVIRRTTWLYEGQYGFRPGYSRESQVITVCQDIADSLDEGGRYRCDHNRLFQGFRLSSSWSAAYETGGLRRGFGGSRLGKGIPCRSYTKGKCRRATIQGSQSNLRCAARKRFGPTTVSYLLTYLLTYLLHAAESFLRS